MRLNGSYEYMASSIFNKGKHIVVICEEGREGESLLRLESEGFKHISTFNFNLWKDNETLSIGRCKAKDAHTYLDVMKDVSNAEDWGVLHVKGAKSIPLINLIDDFSSISDGDVLYCGNGHKSMACLLYTSPSPRD